MMGELVSSELGTGRLSAMTERAGRSSLAVAATQLTSKREATAPTGVGTAVVFERSQV